MFLSSSHTLSDSQSELDAECIVEKQEAHQSAKYWYERMSHVVQQRNTEKTMHADYRLSPADHHLVPGLKHNAHTEHESSLIASTESISCQADGKRRKMHPASLQEYRMS